MSYREIACAFERESKIIEAAWAYELAIQGPDVDREMLLDLAVLYFVCNDTGFSSAYHLHPDFVDAAYPRALEVLALADTRFGKSPETEYWRVHMRERVLGDSIPAEVYERLAEQGAQEAFVSLYAATNRSAYRSQAERAFHAAKRGATARQRYVLSFA
jgi:hypothetical protein